MKFDVHKQCTGCGSYEIFFTIKWPPWHDCLHCKKCYEKYIETESIQGTVLIQSIREEIENEYRI